MKIGMILDAPFPPDPRVENEAVTLVREGHDVFLYCLDFDGSYPEQEIYHGIKVHRNRVPSYMYSLSALAYTAPHYHRRLKKSIEKFLVTYGIERIHIHDIQIARAVFQANRKLDLPVVLDLHENRPEIMKFYRHVKSLFGRMLISPRQWKKFEFKYIRQADKVVVVTKEAADYYAEETGEPLSKFAVVPNTVLPSFYEDYQVDQGIVDRFRDSFGILYLGDTGLRRGLSTAIRAMKHILKYIPHARLIIVGKSTADPLLKKLAREEGVKSQVSFEGWQDFSLFQSYLQASRVGICPIHKNLHHDTTYANKIFQYMAFGLPLVVSNCDAQQHIVKEYGCGLVFNDRDEMDMAEKIVALASDQDLFANASENGRRAVLNDLNWGVYCQELKKIYSD